MALFSLFKSAKTSVSVPPPIPAITPPTAPDATEQAWYQTSWFARYGGAFRAYNPDELVARKGADIYRKMLRDPQVKAAFNLVVDMIISRPWRFETPDDTPQSQEIVDFFTHNLTDAFSGTFSQALRVILQAKAQGYSVSEKIFQPGIWNGQPRWLLHAIKPRQWDSFIFEHDEYGTLTGLLQEQVGTQKRLDPNKFIIFVSHPELDAIYGESDLRSAYRAYWEKDVVQKFWNIHLERLAGGFIAAKQGDKAASLSPQAEANFRESLRNITQSTAMLLPAGYDLSVIHAPTSQAFQEKIEHCDRQIAKSLMVPELLGFSEQGNTGSYSQSVTHFDLFMLEINQQGDMLADALNEQLFADLARWNYGVEEFPRFAFERVTEAQKTAMAMAWALAVEKGLVVNTFGDELRTRELVGYDPREEDTPPVAVQTPALAPVQPAPVPGESQKQMTAKFSEGQAAPWVDRVDFKAIGSLFDAQEKTFLDDLTAFVDTAYTECLDALAKIYNRQPDDKGQIRIVADVEKLNDAITPATKSALSQSARKHLMASYNAGRGIAQGEIKDAAQAAPGTVSDRLTIAAECAPRKAVRVIKGQPYTWTVRNFVEGMGLDTAEKYFAAKSFEMTGQLTQDVLDSAKQALLNSIRDELSYDDMVAALDAILEGKNLKLRKGETTAFRLETIARTNVVDAFNQAQQSVFNDPELGDFVKALQYAATLDQQTTEFCRAYDGKIFDRTDPIWSQITPPNHYRCRSRLIPITAVDGAYKTSPIPTDSQGNAIQPGKGFGEV